MQLRQVFVELVKNSRVAMPRGGRIILSSAFLVDDQVVKVRVEDNGKGILPEHMKQIFEPFFTTKDDWHGKGLGLTMAFKIIGAHSGTLKAESTPGKGTTMTIVPPAATAGAHIV